MKPLLIIFTIACSLPIRADNAIPPTEFERASAETQTVVIRAESIIGSLESKHGDKIEVRACEVSAKGPKHYAVQINGISIDSDEVVPLLNAVESLLKVDKTATKLDDFNASYTTRGGFHFQRYYQASHPNEFTLDIDWFDPNNSANGTHVGNLTSHEIIELKVLIQKAQDKLQSIQ